MEKHRYLKTAITLELLDLNLTQCTKPIHIRASVVDDQHDILDHLGFTEIKKVGKENNSTRFHTKISHEYLFQKRQRLCFSIHTSWKDTDFMDFHQDNSGIVYIHCAEIIQAGTNGVIRNMENTTAKIIVTGKIIDSIHSFKIDMKVKALDMDKKDFPLVTNAYYQLFAGNKINKICESEVIENSIKPSWKIQKFDGDFLDQSCKELIFKIYDRQDPEDPDEDEFVGVVVIPIGNLTHQYDPNKKWHIVHPKKKYKKKRPHSGKLVIEDFTMVKQPEFFGLLQAGLEFKYHVAVDFTSSNGKIDDKQCHHYVHTNENRNLYSDCMQAIGNVVTDYDYIKDITATGFGASEVLETTIKHDYFPLNRKTGINIAKGIDDMLDSYMHCRQSVNGGLSTNCATTIRTVRELAGRCRNEAVYHILLILVDDSVSDMVQTLTELKRCDDEPMSVFFIGIGTGGRDQFAEMAKINPKPQVGLGKNKILQFMQKRLRKLTDFIKYNDMAFKCSNFDNRLADHKISCHISEMLAGELLADLPKQVEEYFLLIDQNAHNIQRRLSPEQGPIFVEPVDKKLVSGPLPPNANYEKIIRSPYAISTANRKCTIPLDVLLAGFSNPTMEGHDHYEFAVDDLKKYEYDGSVSETYDPVTKQNIDPNYLESLYEMQQHNRKTRDTANKGGNIRSGSRLVMDYVDNPFDKQHRLEKKKLGPQVNMTINTKTITIDPNKPEGQQEVKETLQTKKVSNGKVEETKKTTTKLNVPVKKTIKIKEAITVDENGKPIISSSPKPSPIVSRKHSEKSSGISSMGDSTELSPTSLDKIDSVSDEAIESIEINESKTTTKKDPIDPALLGVDKTNAFANDTYFNVEKTSSNPFSQLTAAVDKGENLADFKASLKKSSSVSSSLSSDEVGTTYKSIYIPVPTSTLNRFGRQTEFDTSGFTMEDLCFYDPSTMWTSGSSDDSDDSSESD